MASCNNVGKSVELSVLISTQDRPESLGVTLDLLIQNSIDPALLQVVVIDNAKTPSAQHVTESRQQQLNVIYLHEPRPGKCHALNKALDEVLLAPVVAVIDDDMSPGPDWCCGVLDLCARWPEAGVFAASSYVIWPDETTVPDWLKPGRVSCWALSVIDYPEERTTRPGESMSGNHFWFRRDAVGSRRFLDFWASESHFILGLIDDGKPGVVAPKPCCGHRIQPNLLRLEVQRSRALQFGRHLPKFRLDFPNSIPQAHMAVHKPVKWTACCFANLTRWMLVAATSRLRRSGNRIPTELVARIGIANNLECLRLAVSRTPANAKHSAG